MTEQDYIATVAVNGLLINTIPDDKLTEDICWHAVGCRYSNTLQVMSHIPERFQTLRVCVRAFFISRMRQQLRTNFTTPVTSPLWHVKHQTDEICIEAIRQNAYAIDLVIPRIRLAGIDSANPQIIDPFLQRAIQANPEVANICEQTEEWSLAAVKLCPMALRFIHCQTRKICLAVFSKHYAALPCIHSKIIQKYVVLVTLADTISALTALGLSHDLRMEIIFRLVSLSKNRYIMLDLGTPCPLKHEASDPCARRWYRRVLLTRADIARLVTVIQNRG